MVGGFSWLNPDHDTACCTIVPKTLQGTNSGPPWSLARIPNISVARTDRINQPRHAIPVLSLRLFIAGGVVSTVLEG
jgi:hypothetical protein